MQPANDTHTYSCHNGMGCTCERNKRVSDARSVCLHQVEGAFSQPNGRMCEKMLAWARDVTRDSRDHDLLELYCGNGNFTVGLSDNFRYDLLSLMSS